MLNELIALEQGLAEHGLAATARHPDVSQLLKGDVVHVRLAPDGTIAQLDLLEGTTRGEVWTLRDGKHNGFPGLKTPGGLIKLEPSARAAHDERWKAARSPFEKRAEIKRVTTDAVLSPNLADWPKPGHRARIGERLADLRALDADVSTRAVPEAFARFLAALAVQPPFLHRLYVQLRDLVQDGTDGWPDVARAALVGPVALAIDVPIAGFRREAIDPRQIEAVSRALGGDPTGDGALLDDARRCALTGARTRLLKGNFPQPTLPSLGQTYLFSRNTDIRALTRYGRNGPGAFPVDAELVSRFSGALAALTAEVRRGKTWRLLPAEAGGGQDLFIVFVAADPDGAAADSLVQEPDDFDDDHEPVAGPPPAQLRASAEGATSRLLAFWKGVAENAPAASVRILVLRTVDPGNRKAVYERAATAQDVYRAALGWAAAMHAAPEWLRLPLLRKRKAIEGRPRLQTPLSLIALSRRVYIRGGREATDAPGVSGAEALALFLNEGDRTRRARRLLKLLLDRHSRLLAGLAQAKLRRDLRDFDPRGSAREDALRSVSWIAALLTFSRETKETYMEDAGFRLGQLLAAVDAVHIGYCVEVRKGQVPPTLVGNGVFALAGRDPDRALELLQQRLKPYLAWATGATTRSKATSTAGPIETAVQQVHLVRPLLKDLREALARRRAGGVAPDTAFRAELLLGYVAGVRPEKTSNTSGQDAKESAE